MTCVVRLLRLPRRAGGTCSILLLLSSPLLSSPTAGCSLLLSFLAGNIEQEVEC